MDRPTAVHVTTRAIRLARRAADAGRDDLSRRAWALACRTAWRCGALSGTDRGASFILIDLPGRPAYVAYSPVEM